jgi:sugar/nucleoside kinase (ribokinase family)
MTGAGDAYCGGFVAGFVHDPNRVDCAARVGAVSASFAIAGLGIEALSPARPADAVARLAEWRGRMVPSG